MRSRHAPGSCVVCTCVQSVRRRKLRLCCVIASAYVHHELECLCVGVECLFVCGGGGGAKGRCVAA